MNIGMLTRREFLKQMALMAAMTAAAAIFPGVLFAKEEQDNLLQASTSPNIFC